MSKRAKERERAGEPVKFGSLTWADLPSRSDVCYLRRRMVASPPIFVFTVASRVLRSIPLNVWIGIGQQTKRNRTLPSSPSLSHVIPFEKSLKSRTESKQTSPRGVYCANSSAENKPKKELSIKFIISKKYQSDLSVVGISWDSLLAWWILSLTLSARWILFWLKILTVFVGFSSAACSLLYSQQMQKMPRGGNRKPVAAAAVTTARNPKPKQQQ